MGRLPESVGGELQCVGGMSIFMCGILNASGWDAHASDDEWVECPTMGRWNDEVMPRNFREIGDGMPTRK